MRKYFNDLIIFADTKGYYMSISKEGGEFISVYVHNDETEKSVKIDKWDCCTFGAEYLDVEEYKRETWKDNPEETLVKIKEYLTTVDEKECQVEWCPHCECEVIVRGEAKVPTKCTNCNKYIMICSLCENKDSCELCSKICKKLNGE